MASSRHADHIVLDNIHEPNFVALPAELRANIIAHVSDADPPMTQNTAPRRREHPALSPPRTASTPFMRLPTELRRTVFADLLSDRNVVYPPTCKDGLPARTVTTGSHPSEKPRRNVVSDLMTLCRKIKEEISELLYEERFFVIHVHEGLRDGGIEFLDAGRQPLQYKDHLDDPRFHKFGKDDDFGFRRVKKIIIEIHPSQEDTVGHTAINTYLMCQALACLLERCGGEKNRITSLRFVFPNPKPANGVTGRAAIQRAESYWWDPDAQKARATSLHTLPDFELVLRPFAILTGCHSVVVEPPEALRTDQSTLDFIADLTHMMKRKNVMDAMPARFMNAELERHIESARYALEEYVGYTLHNKGYHDVPKMTETEMVEEEEEELEDEAIVTPESKKRRSSEMRRQHEEQSPKDEEDMEWAILASRRAWHEQEQKELNVAIAESLREAHGTVIPGLVRMDSCAAPDNHHAFGSRQLSSHTAAPSDSISKGHDQGLVDYHTTAGSSPFQLPALASWTLHEGRGFSSSTATRFGRDVISLSSPSGTTSESAHHPSSQTKLAATSPYGIFAHRHGTNHQSQANTVPTTPELKPATGVDVPDSSYLAEIDGEMEPTPGAEVPTFIDLTDNDENLRPVTSVEASAIIVPTDAADERGKSNASALNEHDDTDAHSLSSSGAEIDYVPSFSQLADSMLADYGAEADGFEPWEWDVGERERPLW